MIIRLSPFKDEDGPDYDRDAIDDVERTTSGPCIGGSCVGGKARTQHRQKQHGDYGVKKTCTTVEARIAKTMGRVGPSMFLSSLAESVAFFCGTLLFCYSSKWLIWSTLLCTS